MSRRKTRRLMNQINVVPYIDVTLVLLVIFMVTAPLTNPGVVELPKVGQALKQTSVPLVITVKKDNSIEMEGEAIQRDQLLSQVKMQVQKEPQRAVVVAADESVKYGKVIEIMDMLKQAKVEKVGLLFNPASNR